MHLLWMAIFTPQKHLTLRKELPGHLEGRLNETSKEPVHSVIHSFTHCCMPYKSISSSKARSPQNSILCFPFQIQYPLLNPLDYRSKLTLEALAAR